MTEPFRYIVPLGDWCIVAHQLKRKLLRKSSLPFDWNFSNLSAALRILPIDTPNETLYLYKKPAQWPIFEGHAKQFTFAHHDFSKEEVKDHWRRSLQRMIWIFKQSSPVLFVHASVDQSKRDSEKLIQVRDVLKTKYPHLQFEILSIEQHVGAQVESTVNIYRKESTIVYADVLTKTRWDGNDWDAPHDSAIWDKMLNYFPIELKDLPPRLGKE